jgi:hypothetical protein
MRSAGLHLNPADLRRPRTRGTASRLPSGEQPELDWDGLGTLLGHVKHGQFVTAHWPRDLELRTMLDELGYRTIFLFRDPRDVVVSSMFFVMARPSHPLHGRYARLGSDGDRLLASIRGLEPTPEARGFPGIPSQYARFRPWLIEDGTLPCRFEDLVGERGGGSDQAQREAVEAIGRHLARPLTPDRRERIAARAWSAGSVTFRKGAIGEWRRHFDERHLEAFHGKGAEMVRAYGYEPDDSWLERPEPAPIRTSSRSSAR